MQYKQTLTAAALASTALAAYKPNEPWSTLTPTATYSNALTDYTGSFGIAVVPLATTASSAAKAKRDAVSQIGDGQIQAATTTTSTVAPKKSTAAAVSQIGDGQIQATTKTEAPKQTAAAVSQIGDGQIQATTKTEAPKQTAAAVSQIGDGQIQATTKTEAPKQTAAAVSQIGDGQIQATTNTVLTKESAAAVSQIGDGQIQATTKAQAPKSTAAAVSQIGDGQIQATTRKTTTLDGKTFTPSATEDGSKTTSTTPAQNSPSDEDSFFQAEACKNNGTLSMTLKNGILTDIKGRVGSIVANRQFQFDGPPPQAGAIYAAGWSITPEGNLAIGSNDVFYQCLSGNFYNLYDESQGKQCQKVYLQAIELVNC
ncbi:hypothetical protein TBLA_0A04270 [Henningerozyma blattae CBS 6284]|uniref:Cell wall mannoprotein PIR1-like C-terminal domain-containing protein n=1 Tax=Henningerozyma blattae (strain ATCC 34711 / CBS 6284 / DSM 70876 / NBRC 10599 / NRRL Y-10934 / UCD 77-7) TaxID=1071380 RepID=I2GVS0_HENB6|nr:hypothetical protein TBLA_0A04270 [Tetrapisispora blattae CBS 6284]CCH58222.1 hypothetical protein TBLA_0A04270 [Tetrapisispora blattae CBS 6284]